jgi:3-oxoacyl-[acyl-carrier protein] reductase
MQARRFDGRRAVVTGGSSGIGRAIALALAREGARVLVTYRRNAQGAEETATTIRSGGGEAVVAQADVSDAAGAESLADAAFAKLGRVDVWVNNAGADILTGEGARLSPAAKLDVALGVDVGGTVRLSWRAAEHMRAAGGGVILNVSWDRVLTGAAGREAEIYAAAKGAVLAFSKSLARSFAPEVRVNVLAPGWIATAFSEQLSEARRREVAAGTPLGRWGTPEDVAEAALFLASAESGFVTGATLLVGGGAVM